jgi:hypothetical protein
MKKQAEKKRYYKCVDKGYALYEYGSIYPYENVEFLVKMHPEDWIEIVDYTGGCVGAVIPKNSFEGDLKSIMETLYKKLVDKNRKYGNSALKPISVFSKSNTNDQLKARIDDKLSRIKNAPRDEDEDVVDDLIGYLFLLKMSKNGKG